MNNPSISPSISIIIPVYNGGENFKICLKQLLLASPKPLEIIVVDDASQDNSKEFAESLEVMVINNPTNQGPAKARNQGASIAKGDILLFIDADVAVSIDIISRVTSLFEQNQAVSAIFGSYDDSPGDKNFLSQYRNLLHHYIHQTANSSANTFWTGCGGVKRNIFLALGGFDEKRLAIEDIEFGYRLKAANHQILLDKSLQVKHLKRWTILSLLKTDFFVRALPWSEMILQGQVFVNDLNLTYSSRISVMLAFSLPTSLLFSCYIPTILIFSISCIFGLLALNWKLYNFFFYKRGFLFTLQVLPWHWIYYIYSGLAFLIAILKVRILKPLQRLDN